MTTRMETPSTEQAASAERVATANDNRNGGTVRESNAGTAQRDNSRGVENAAGERTRRPMTGARQQAPVLPAIFAAPPGVLMNAFLKNPWEFIQYMQDEMDRDFPTTGSRPGAPDSLRYPGSARNAQRAATAESRTVWTPVMESFRRGNDLVVRAELPGLRTDDIDVSVQDDTLVIAGERKQQHENIDEGSYRSERRYGSFQRALPLPDGVNEEQISASFSDGVLEVRLPLPEPARKTARKVKIS